MTPGSADSEWFSCTNRISIPCLRSTSSRKISEKKPRASPCRTGRISFTSAMSVGITCMRLYTTGRRAIEAPRACRPLAGCASLTAMRPPNYYSHSSFERAGLRRRDLGWIREQVLHPESLFIPVWRSQNLVIEVEGGEPRAAVLAVDAVAPVLGGALSDVEERLAHGQIVFLGVHDERAHFALDVSGIEAPLEMVRSPALAAAGITDGGTAEAGVRFADLRQLGGRLDRREGALLALARA